jgi:AmmeMemoRadiSam system protein B
VRSFIAAGAASEASIPAARRIVAVIAPHAGYAFSGPIAGHSYAAVAKRDFRTVIVLGPSHHVLRDKAALLGVDAYRTPLGDVPIAGDVVAALLKKAPDLFRIDPETFTGEHSVEVQLPFVQVAFPKARVVPVVVPALSAEKLDRIAEVLFRSFGTDSSVLVVASSDLSHFFAYDEAKKLDLAIADEIEHSDTRALLDNEEARRGPCGVAPIVITLDYLGRFDGSKAITRLAMKNSADTSDVGRDRVVGYGSFVLSRGK